MRIPMKVDHGVRALVELALAPADVHVPTANIARKQGIPESYLDQALTSLRKAGLIHSRRGPGGGHTLAKPAEAIDLAMVMEALDSRGPILSCLVEPDGCRLAGCCAQREVWAFFEEAMRELLANTTIASMARRQQELTQSQPLTLQLHA